MRVLLNLKIIYEISSTFFFFFFFFFFLEAETISLIFFIIIGEKVVKEPPRGSGQSLFPTPSTETIPEATSGGCMKIWRQFDSQATFGCGATL